MAQRLRSGGFYSSVMKAVIASIVASLPMLSFSAEPSAGTWRWYYAAYGSTGSDAKLFIRSGSASVLIDGAAIKIELREASGGDAPSFVGKFEGARISGKLTKFFPSGDEARQGEYREKRISNCKWRQYSIWPEYPDGSVLIVSRIEGTCQ